MSRDTSARTRIRACICANAVAGEGGAAGAGVPDVLLLCCPAGRSAIGPPSPRGAAGRGAAAERRCGAARRGSGGARCRRRGTPRPGKEALPCGTARPIKVMRLTHTS